MRDAEGVAVLEDDGQSEEIVVRVAALDISKVKVVLCAGSASGTVGR